MNGAEGEETAFAKVIAKQLKKRQREQVYAAVRYAACFHDLVEEYDDVQVVETTGKVKKIEGL